MTDIELICINIMTEILYYVLVYNGRYILNDFHNDTVTVFILMNINFRVLNALYLEDNFLI